MADWDIVRNRVQGHVNRIGRLMFSKLMKSRPELQTRTAMEPGSRQQLKYLLRVLVLWLIPSLKTERSLIYDLSSFLLLSLPWEGAKRGRVNWGLKFGLPLMSYVRLRRMWSQLETSYCMTPWENFWGQIAPQNYSQHEASLPSMSDSLELKAALSRKVREV